MKFPSMLMSVVVAGFAALPLTVSCRAEEAKVRFAQGAKIEVQIARPSKVDRNQGGDFDNKTQIIEPKIKITNTTPQQGYIGYKALFLLLIDSVAERGTSKVVLEHKFDITLPPKQFMETEAGSARATYDENGIKWGWKYGTWVIQVTDPKGEVVLTKSTAASLEKQADLIKTLKLDQCYNRQWKPCPEPRN
ncbi:MAG: hypothetical protein IPK22_16835 [Verrucomicrobiaceae bacterium]|nr:hypothetical protein [Verrucomicrobiaceae bacterium]